MSLSRLFIFIIGLVLAIVGLFITIQNYTNIELLIIGLILIIAGVVLLNGEGIQFVKQNTFIIPILQDAYLPRMLETLYKHTDQEQFSVIVIDNSGGGSAREKCERHTDIWVKGHRNFGFAQSMNLGVRLASTKYVTLANDDTEFMDNRWWQGIIDTFAQDARIVAVNPMSPKDATWGFGHTADNHDTWEPKEGYFAIDNKTGMVPIIDGKPFVYKEEYTPEEYDLLINKHPNWGKDSLLDGIATWMTVVRREDMIGRYARIGMLDERFYPGGGEDIDFNCRVYSCAWPIEREECDPDYHYRAVGTARSYVWHHWSKSQDISAKDPYNTIFKGRERWNYLNQIWKNGEDTWGHIHKDGKRIPCIRDPQVYIHDL